MTLLLDLPENGIMKMKKNPYEIQHHFFPSNREEILKKLGKEVLLKNLQRMLLIRNFEIRAESAYQQGLIGGFFIPTWDKRQYKQLYYR